ncbi:low molecular weight phosphatase family protein [Natrinema caseinilyticum]|uniref:arsenate-mycothiol transferase ArsC n=1 Tax=Natrinema caseinilyticum TaxID=2961570 RepID=UPI0020C489D6|nr:low molecular weight phosphatase family protein [Natrinema caseinilyticum]
MSQPTEDDAVTVAFVCVQNAGRSQMATAFAERERVRRGLEDRVHVISGGTEPADRVHDVVVEVMSEIGISLEDERPEAITHDETTDADIVVTMGCSAENVCPMTWRGDARDWALEDPHGRSLEVVREIRDGIEENVSELFDELTETLTERSE